MLEEDHGGLQPFAPQLVDQRTLFAQAVGMVALGNDHHLGVSVQQGFCLFVQPQIGQEEELHGGRTGGHEHELLLGEHGIGIGLASPEVGIYEVARSLGPLRSLWQIAPHVVVIGAEAAFSLRRDMA